MKQKTLLIFGIQIPEPNSTAAGSRMLQLMDLFAAFGFEIHFACSTPQTEFSIDLNQIRVNSYNIQLNDNSAKRLLNELRPQLVLFDRFITEEQFGWMVDEVCPDALKILDTEDLHFLRENREQLVKHPETKIDELTFTDKAKREIGAIYRCDLSLMISKAEIEILSGHFQIPESILVYLPFLLNLKAFAEIELTSYQQRQHFMSIGNFKHAPNLDMVKHLYQNIWPKIKQDLPDAEWHIYGAYLPQQIKEMHHSKKGIIVKGRAQKAINTIRNYKVMLAPLRFGAGLKGKCIDSMQAGTPSVTTSIGAEGIAKSIEWPGSVKDDTNAFIKAASELYSNEKLWLSQQNQGFKLLKRHFDVELYKSDFKEVIEQTLTHLHQFRQNNRVGALLKHHLHRSTKFMSLWIEEKNKRDSQK